MSRLVEILKKAIELEPDTEELSSPEIWAEERENARLYPFYDAMVNLIEDLEGAHMDDQAPRRVQAAFDRLYDRIDKAMGYRK